LTRSNRLWGWALCWPGYRRELANVPISRDMARLGELQQGDLDYEVLAGPNRGQAKDAVIALTAGREADVLVGDTRRHFQKRLKGKSLLVWDFDQFHEWVDRVSGSAE
jgi:hypothetical protein